MANHWVNDLRYAARTLLRSPLFSGVAIASLALGLGANTAIFGLLDQVLVRPISGVQAPAELVLLDSPGANRGSIRGEYAFSYPMYRDVRDKNQVFTGVLARFPLSMNVGKGTETEKADGEIVSGNYFELLGVQPFRGRLLTTADDQKMGAHPVVVLSFDYWQRRFGADASVVNQKIELNGYPMEVVGIAAPEFRGVQIGRASDLFAPMAMKKILTPTWDDMEERRALWLSMMARLKPGVTRPQAEKGLEVLYRPLLEMELSQMSGNMPERFRKRFVEKKLLALPGAGGIPGLRRDFSTPLLVLMTMVGLVLLIACANLANLLLARAAARRKEIAVRLALGAQRGDLIRQLLIESALLAVLGGLAAMVVASWSSDLLIRSIPDAAAVRSLSSGLDWRMLAFNFALALFTGVLFGLAPALKATKPDIAPTLKDQAVAGGWAQIRSRKALVVAQVALSLLLLVGAGLFTRSLGNLRQLDPGFQAQSVVQFMLDATLTGKDQPHVRNVYNQMENRLLAVPGVSGVGLSEGALITGDRSMATVGVQGYQAKEGEDMNPDVNGVSPGFFQTLGIAQLKGRDFRPQDDLGAPRVAVVNETFARYFFGDQSALGRRFHFGRNEKELIEIVGVVKDSKYTTLRDKPVRMVYVPYRQQRDLSFMTVYVRTSQDPALVMDRLRSSVAEIDSGLALFGLKTMKVQMEESLFAERMVAQLCLFFGGLATLLAAIGLYGVMAYSVSRRTREIGIRMALGSGRNAILNMVLREVGWMAGLGIVLGLPLAIGLSRLVESQLYGLKPHDPLTLASATLLLAAVALLAGFVPAQRAARIDPLQALHYE